MIILLKTPDGVFINLDRVIAIYSDTQIEDEEKEYETDEEILADLKYLVMAKLDDGFYYNWTSKRTDKKTGKHLMRNNQIKKSHIPLFYGNKEDHDLWLKQFEFTMSRHGDPRQISSIIDINALITEAKEREEENQECSEV